MLMAQIATPVYNVILGKLMDELNLIYTYSVVIG